MLSTSEKAVESRARRAAQRVGLVATKSRRHLGSIHNCGGFMLVNEHNGLEAGEHYDLSAEEVIEYCAD